MLTGILITETVTILKRILTGKPYTFLIGKKGKQYIGRYFRLGWIKIELITFKRNFNFKIEISNWGNK
jgi:hypothetical protein